jgi:hypothetical protein
MPTLDEQVRWTAFGLLVRHGRPVEVTDLAGVMPSGADPEAVPEAVSRLGAGGQIDIGQGGAVIGAAGLTLGPAPHRLLLRGRDYRTCRDPCRPTVASAPGRLPSRCRTRRRPSVPSACGFRPVARTCGPTSAPRRSSSALPSTARPGPSGRGDADGSSICERRRAWGRAPGPRPRTRSHGSGPTDEPQAEPAEPRPAPPGTARAHRPHP